MPVIMAHGFWLMNDDKGLDVLDGFFRKYPHLNVDLSADPARARPILDVKCRPKDGDEETLSVK